MSEPSLYLFTGPEFGERNDAVDKIKKATKKKYGESDEYLFYAQETSVSEVVGILQSGSLFASASCIVFRGAELIKKKDDIELLASWVKNSVESSILILVSDEISVDSKLEKIVPKANKRIFWEMFEDRKIPWISDFFTKNGYSIEPDAAQTILDLVENNTQSLKAECSRFFLCFPTGTRLNVENVESVIAHNRGETAFTLFNTMSDKNLSVQKRFENSLGILQKIRLSKDSSAVMIIAGLSSCFRRLTVWQNLHENGSSPDDFTLKISGFSSKSAKTQYSSAATIWSAGQVAAIMALLSQADMNIRSSGTAFEDTQLFLLIYSIIVKKGASLSFYGDEAFTA
jgi:DNA polymerase-3 subunit delta